MQESSGDDWLRLPADALGAGDLVAALDRWAAEMRVDDAARARSRERWLRQQAAEAASFAGVLFDLAERRRAVVLSTSDGERIRGHVEAIGVDFIAITNDQRRAVLVRIDAVAAVRARAGGAALASDRTVSVDLDLHQALDRLAADRPRLAVTTGDGDVIAGELRAVGRDLLTLRLDGDAADHLYVRLDAVRAVTLIER